MLIIHVLPPEDYALYIIAYSFLTTIIVVSDSGIGSAVLAEGGKVWQDSTKLGQVITTGLEIRKRFSLVAIIIALPHDGAISGSSWRELEANHLHRTRNPAASYIFSSQLIY